MALEQIGKFDDKKSIKAAKQITKYVVYANKLSDQVKRRVFNGESIPNDEKVFSIFEEHTEIIRKGKVATPQEFGIRVCIMEESNYGFILHHMVMQKQEDEKVTVDMVIQSQSKYNQLRSCSFDAGFYTPDNLKQLQQHLDLCVMPTKGNKRLPH